MSVPDRVVKEMALTGDDVARLLPGAAEGFAVAATADGYRLDRGTASVAIRLAPLPDRRIALLRLPVMRVTLAFDGLGADERRAFLERFDTAFRRGGG